MPQRVSIDDVDEKHINYQGSWELVMGSSRQWEMSVHSTLTPGSTATFNFKGYQVWVWGTIPPGVGSNLIDVSIDGETPTSITRTPNGSAVYNEPYFSSELLRNGYHQIVVTGRGSADKGNSEFLLDRFEFQTDDETPSFTSSGSSSSTASSTTFASAPTTPTTSTTNSSSSGTTHMTVSEKKTTPAGAIAGAIVGALALIALVTGYLLWRRRKRRAGQVGEEGKSTKRIDKPRNPFAPDPFPLEGKPPSHVVPDTTLSAAIGTGSQVSTQNQEHISEKSTYQSSHPGSSLYSPMSTAGSTQALVPVRMGSSSTLAISSSKNLSRSPLSPSDGSLTNSSPTSRNPDSFVHLQTMTEMPTSPNEGFEHPPPSYTHHDEGGSGSVLSYR